MNPSQNLIILHIYILDISHQKVLLLFFHLFFIIHFLVYLFNVGLVSKPTSQVEEEEEESGAKFVYDAYN